MDIALREATLHLQHGRPDRAEIILRDALRTNPDAHACLGLLGLTLAQCGKLAQATEHLQRAAKIAPGDLSHNYTLANVLLMQGLHEDALPYHEAATRLAPNHYWALVNHGISLARLGRHAPAIDRFKRAIQVDGGHPAAWLNLGNSQRETGHNDAALNAYDAAIRRAPDYAEAHYNRGIALYALKRVEDAITSYRAAIRLKQDYADALYNLGEILREQRRVAEAADVYATLHAFAPGFHQVRGQWLHAKLDGCDWRNIESLIADAERDIEAGRNTVQPFVLQAVCGSEALLARCARTYSATRFPAPTAKSDARTGGDSGMRSGSDAQVNRKIRIGYLCGEFRQQATSLLLAGVYERHDRARFSIHAFDSGYDDESPMRRRLKAAFDDFIEITGLSDEDAAREIQAREIDILVNLNGFFGFSRQGVFARRPAPIQVNYLGFPGTIGADYIDYLIADRIVIPEDARAHYTEQVVYLPDCYQPNDASRVISGREFGRTELGLPEKGFVFCCFNNNYKILPEVFSGWMRILAAVDGSVLWLLKDNDAAEVNLRREAQARGIDPARLVFAPRWPSGDHLARHRQADLFLDTSPYNAHTTGSDALWAGLPLLTCRGTTFPGRVGASLLNAVGLPELITETPQDYEAMAIKLAQSPDRLQALRERLARNRLTAPLFDTARYTRSLEGIYRQMMESVSQPSNDA